MTNIATEPLNRSWKLGFPDRTVRRTLVNLAERYRRWRKDWTVLSELRRHSGGQLAELGISASDIDHIFDEPSAPERASGR